MSDERFRYDEIIYVTPYVRLRAFNEEQKKIKSSLADIGGANFFSPDMQLTLSGFNKPSRGVVNIPLIESFTELGLENKETADHNNESVKRYKKRRDAIHTYLLENKWIPLEIYFCEKSTPFSDLDNDLLKVEKLIQRDEDNNSNPLASQLAKTAMMDHLDEEIQVYKVFDGLGYQANLKYNKTGHYIRMSVADRLVLFENDVVDGKLKNKNTIQILQELCSRVGLKLKINKGIPFNTNAFISKNKNNAISPFQPTQKAIDLLNKKDKEFSLNNQNIGTHNWMLDNKVADSNFLLNAKKSIDVLRALAKSESAIYYVNGDTLYFGGIDKTEFKNLLYTWGDSIIDLDIDIVVPKPLKDKDDYPYYIELKSYDPVTNKSYVATRGKKPPEQSNGTGGKKGNLKSSNGVEQINLENGFIPLVGALPFSAPDKNGKGASKGKKAKQENKASQTIFIYEKVTGLNQKQIERMADAYEFALQHGAIQGSLDVALDYSITPYDTIMLKNISTPMDTFVFNIEEISYSFNVNNGISQKLKITTGHDSVFEGERKNLQAKVTTKGKGKGKGKSGKTPDVSTATLDKILNKR